MSASQELLNEVACLIREHSDEIAAVAIEEYRASYPHLKRFSMSPERAKEWSASALE